MCLQAQWVLPLPNVPIEFDAVIVIPSDNYATDIINQCWMAFLTAYFPQTNEVSADNLEISTGVTALADFIDDSILSYLTDFWNATVAPLFTAVGARCTYSAIANPRQQNR